ncbi:MAG: hypothetical protein HQM16_17970 [Deltaproteobacteria bacterium]|nr:hypothetical protein [Deltaproteobacteria bacterium]
MKFLLRLKFFKPSTVTVNLRMPLSMVNALKMQANKQDVPYQSYMKMIIAEVLKTTDGANFF